MSYKKISVCEVSEKPQESLYISKEYNESTGFYYRIVLCNEALPKDDPNKYITLGYSRFIGLSKSVKAMEEAFKKANAKQPIEN